MDSNYDISKHRTGFTCRETKLLGMSWRDKNGNEHFAPTKEFIDKYIDAYIDSQKIFRPVNKITKELR